MLFAGRGVVFVALMVLVSLAVVLVIPSSSNSNMRSSSEVKNHGVIFGAKVPW